MPTPTYTKTGTKANTATKLDADIFGVKEINEELVHQAYVTYLSNGRINLANTKTRGLVRGGGKKPWKQKGTGRARVGSRRSPLWRSGGIIFGPTGEENYTKKLNIKSKRIAIKHSLSSANKNNSIIVIEDIISKTAKTNELVSLLNKLHINDGYTLIVTDSINTKLNLASRNLSNTKVIQAKYLNVARILDADTIIITKAALDIISNWLGATTKANEAKNG